ncbi:metal-dependent hydrolase [Halalkalibacter urbisdiaboli]|uniref:metal-dependent hydrolase n=1 Tax=Halalkalibacter urbisdiaboli TaxID=1960589 RepID=UPI000B4363DC|nr:metal-dependent hydrolase [Halalkalibacter urbisdiaboli]
MTGKTHIVGGLSACLFVDTVIVSQASPLFYFAGVAGALLPDICHRKSKMGRKVPLLSTIISLVFGHRTFTHSILFIGIILLLVHLLLPNAMMIRDGLFIGLISHLLLDAATARGIQMFYPLKLKVRLPLYTKTGSVIEHVFFFFLCLSMVYMLIELANN